MTGGNRTGKSEVGIIESLSHVLGHRPDGSRDNLPRPPVSILCMGEDRQRYVNKIFMKKLDFYVPRSLIKKVKNGQDGNPELITFENGSDITLGSYKQEARTHEGLDWAGVWFDEPPPRPLWISIRRGLLDQRGRAWFTLTPLSCPWIYNELYSKANGDHISSFVLDLLDNPYISETEKQEFINDLTPEEIESRIHGKFSHLQGVIFPEFKRDIHVVEPFQIPYDWPKFMVMDPHDRRPSVMMWVAVDPRDRLFVYREWPHEDFSRMKTCRKSTRDYVMQMRLEEGEEKIRERIVDPNFSRTQKFSTARTLIEEFEEFDIHFENEISNDIAAGHALIHDRLRKDLGDPQLFVMENCMNTIWSFENYIWNPKDLQREYEAKERPGESGKDFMDCLRYLLDYGPRYANWDSTDWNRSNFGQEPVNRGVTGYG